MLHFNLLLNRVGCCILISDEFFPRLRSGYNEEDIILPTAYFYAALAAGIGLVLGFFLSGIAGRRFARGRKLIEIRRYGGCPGEREVG